MTKQSSWLTGDDLQVGLYVALVNRRLEIPEIEFGDREVMIQLTNMGFSHYDGAVLKIIAVDLPFVLVENTEGSKFSIDFRQCDLKQLSRTYVDAVLGRSPDPNCQNVSDTCPVTFFEIDKHGELYSHKKCPKCNSKLIQRMKAGSGWWLFCKNCENFVSQI